MNSLARAWPAITVSYYPEQKQPFLPCLQVVWVTPIIIIEGDRRRPRESLLRSGNLTHFLTKLREYSRTTITLNEASTRPCVRRESRKCYWQVKTMALYVFSRVLQTYRKVDNLKVSHSMNLWLCSTDEPRKRWRLSWWLALHFVLLTHLSVKY